MKAEDYSFRKENHYDCFLGFSLKMGGRNSGTCTSLQLFQRYPPNIHDGFVTVNATTTYHQMVEITEFFKQWFSSRNTSPKKSKIAPLEGRNIVIAFRNFPGVNSDLFGNGVVISNEYIMYRNLTVS